MRFQGRQEPACPNQGASDLTEGLGHAFGYTYLAMGIRQAASHMHKLHAYGIPTAAEPAPFQRGDSGAISDEDEDA